MYWRPTKLVISVTLVAAIVVIDVSALKCVSQSSCSCHLPDGRFFDLSKVSPASPLEGHQYEYKFSFQPCKDVKMNLDKPQVKSACNDNTGVSLCARMWNPNATVDALNMPFSLGTTSDTKWNVPDNEEPQLTLIHGTNTTQITLFCCNNCLSTDLVMVGAPTANKFHFILSSPRVCASEPPPEGISTGSVLVILLFVFSGVYLLIGALALRFFRGAIGWELIPNYDFWSDLPALVRDGVAFTFSGCSADSYDRI